MLRAAAPSVLMTVRASATTRSRVSARRLSGLSGGLNHSGCRSSPAAARGRLAIGSLRVPGLTVNDVHTIVNTVTRKRMSFTRIAFFPGSAWAVGSAEQMRENDMTVMTSWELFDDMRTAQDELL